MTGLNEVLVIGALLAFAGAIARLWLVREGDIEREPLEAEPEPEPAPDATAGLTGAPCRRRR